jgi:hypothetical protein
MPRNGCGAQRMVTGLLSYPYTCARRKTIAAMTIGDILVVERDDDIRRRLAAILHGLHLHAITTSSLAEALRKTKRNSVQAVIADCASLTGGRRPRAANAAALRKAIERLGEVLAPHANQGPRRWPHDACHRDNQE